MKRMISNYEVPITKREDNRKEFIKRLKENLKEYNVEINLVNNYNQYSTYNIDLVIDDMNTFADFHILYPIGDIECVEYKSYDEDNTFIDKITSIIKESF